jgi:hypothetical protein
MPKFSYGDTVQVAGSAPKELRPTEKGWVVGAFGDVERQGRYFNQFPPGVVYTIEFEDGAAIDVHESNLEAIQR